MEAATQVELTPWLVRYGYEMGAFPMTTDDGRIEWFQVPRRALLPIEGIRVSRSLGQTIRSQRFDIRFDTAFESVIRGCIRPSENWISEPIVLSFVEIHRQGWAHSAETWLDGELVGGVYGLSLGACFCAESMFHRARDASKVALWALVERCRELGFTMIDAQVMSPHLESLGAFDISHQEYLQRLCSALTKRTPWDTWGS